MALGNNIPNVQLPVSAITVATDPINDQQARGYKVLRCIVPQMPLPPAPGVWPTRDSEAFKVEGDTLTILEISGPHDIGVSLNAGNQFLQIKEGDVLTRRFNEFKFRSFGIWPKNFGGGTQATAGSTQSGMVLVAVSWGPLLTRHPLKPGYRSGGPKFQGTAPTAGIGIFRGSTFSIDGGIPQQVCKRGGTIMIRNMDTVAKLFVFDAVDAPGIGPSFDQTDVVFPGPSTSWPIFPGEVHVIDAESTLGQSYSWNFGKAAQLPTLCVAGEGAPVRYAVWISSWGDASDGDAQNGIPASIASWTSLEYGGR